MFATEKTQDMLETNTISQKGPIEIKESKYGKVDPTFVAAQQKHLSPQQQQELAALLHKFPKLFGGGLGKYPHWKVHLDLWPDYKSVCKQPYAVAHAHQSILQKELQKLCEFDVLEKTGASE